MKNVITYKTLFLRLDFYFNTFTMRTYSNLIDVCKEYVKRVKERGEFF